MPPLPASDGPRLWCTRTCLGVAGGPGQEDCPHPQRSPPPPPSYPHLASGFPVGAASPTCGGAATRRGGRPTPPRAHINAITHVVAHLPRGRLTSPSELDVGHGGGRSSRARASRFVFPDGADHRPCPERTGARSPTRSARASSTEAGTYVIRAGTSWYEGVTSSDDSRDDGQFGCTGPPAGALTITARVHRPALVVSARGRRAARRPPVSSRVAGRERTRPTARFSRPPADGRSPAPSRRSRCHPLRPVPYRDGPTRCGRRGSRAR